MPTVYVCEEENESLHALCVEEAAQSPLICNKSLCIDMLSSHHKLKKGCVKLINMRMLSVVWTYFFLFQFPVLKLYSFFKDNNDV